MTISALFVESNGCYFGIEGIDPWDQERDARLYTGPHPVVAHPPCQRWGKLWGGQPLHIKRTGERKTKGDDGGCFEAALAAVRKWGGVLEHPERSHAWTHFGLNKPPREGGWIVADFLGGWTCCVEQRGYGHYARKPTWLYAAKTKLPPPCDGERPNADLILPWSSVWGLSGPFVWERLGAEAAAGIARHAYIRRQSFVIC